MSSRIRTSPGRQTATRAGKPRQQHKRPQTVIGVMFGGQSANIEQIATTAGKSTGFGKAGHEAKELAAHYSKPHDVRPTLPGLKKSGCSASVTSSLIAVHRCANCSSNRIERKRGLLWFRLSF